MKQRIVLYFKNGKTQKVETSNPEKAKRIFGAESYIPLKQFEGC